MARITTISIKEEPDHYTVTRRSTINFLKEFADFTQKAFNETGDYLNELGLYPISGPIVCFHNMELTALDVAAGWEIAKEINNKDDILCHRIPTRKAATAIDLGPYEKQDPTLMDIMEWVKEKGFEAEGPIYYCYLNDTHRPETEYLTQMRIPIK